MKGEADLYIDRQRDEDLARPVELKEKMFLAPKLGPVFYVRQIAEAGGLQTCYPTSLLNAWIHQGAITQLEAQRIQDRFRSDLRRLFRHIPQYGYSTHAQNPYEFTQLVASELGKTPRFYNMSVARLNAAEVKKILLQELTRGNLVVVGDKFHASLVVGYSDYGHELGIRDPMQPQSIIMKKTLVVTEAIANDSDKFIGIIPSDRPMF